MAPGHTLKLMAPANTLSVDASRPHTSHTSNIWPQATDSNLMAPGHTLSVDGPRPHTWCYLGLLKVYGLKPSIWSVGPGAINLMCVAWGHQPKVCGLGPSSWSVWPGAINLSVWPGAINLKCVARGHPANNVRNITFVKVPFSSFMDEGNEDVLRT